jgi:hypothetical protein
MTADAGEKDFLRRWSRLKTEARENEARTNPERDGAPRTPSEPQSEGAQKRDAMQAQRPVVPSVDTLNIDSDYRPFFHPKIEEGVRRAALKKLFSDPHFNVMDGLDVYIDDYSKSDPLPEGMLEQLEQAKKILAWAREDTEERAKAEARNDAAAVASAAAGDMIPLQDGVPPAEAGASTSSTAASIASAPDSTPRVE